MCNFTVLLLLLIIVVIQFTHLSWSLRIHLLPTFQYLRGARHVLHPCGTPLVLRGAHYLLSLTATTAGCLISLVPRAALVRIADQLIKSLLFVVNDRPLLLILSDHGGWRGRPLKVRGSLLVLLLLLFLFNLVGDIVLCLHIFDMILRLLLILLLHIFKLI